jgi:hypothetical protein
MATGEREKKDATGHKQERDAALKGRRYIYERAEPAGGERL